MGCTIGVNLISLAGMIIMLAGASTAVGYAIVARRMFSEARRIMLRHRAILSAYEDTKSIHLRIPVDTIGPIDGSRFRNVRTLTY